jgi:tRNA 5-methylaminomethyl-2-thiouridine biosynthesis bifunctional protein
LAESAQQWQQLRAAFAGHHDWVQFVDAALASRLAHCPIPAPALWFPDAGWLAPAAVCAAQAAHPLIDIRCDWPGAALERDANGWRLHGERGELTAAIVVVATAAAARTLLPAAALPLKPIRGQVTELPERWLQQRPEVVICHEGYLAPAPGGGLHLGATFDQGDTDTTLRSADHRRNLASLAQALPALLATAIDAIPLAQLPGRVGFRCATPDYLPMVGAVADVDALRERFAPLAKNAKARVSGAGAWQPGLYLNVGHGSRGLTSTPLCAELLAALIAGEPRPLPRALVQALSPARFALRDLIRGR